MKKIILYPFFLILSFLFIITGCQREVDSNLPPNPQLPAIEETVTANVAGRVVDEKNEPVIGALVSTATGGSVSTTINGEFRLQNVQLKKDAGFIKVEKTGYFTGSRTFIVSTTSDNHTQIQLIPKTSAGSFVASAGGTITIPTGGSLVFPSNSIINVATNTVYSGNVSVAAFFLNPQAGNFGEIMPGALRGNRTDNSEVVLQSFGMMAVELTGAGGERLQLANAKTATFNLPFPSSLLAAAPATIPLWYFDETKGLWKEEGNATRQGSNYAGAVSHFSFWNCDAPFPVVAFETTFKNQGGQPIQKAKVVITTANKVSISASEITNAEGKVAGKLPANTAMIMDVYNYCGALIYSKNIDASASAINLGTITINTSAPATLNLSGAVKDCNNAPVTNGFVQMVVNNNAYRASITNGNFSASIDVCSAGNYNVTITGYDITNNKQSDSTVLNVTSGTPATFPLTICAAGIDRFLNYTLNGSSYNILAPVDSILYYKQGSTATLSAYSFTNGINKVSLNFPDVTAIGTVPLTNIQITVKDSAFIGQNISTMSITEYSTTATGIFIAGNVAGSMKYDSASSATYPLNLSFRVKK